MVLKCLLYIIVELLMFFFCTVGIKNFIQNQHDFCFFLQKENICSTLSFKLRVASLKTKCRVKYFLLRNGELKAPIRLLESFQKLYQKRSLDAAANKVFFWVYFRKQFPDGVIDVQQRKYYVRLLQKRISSILRFVLGAKLNLLREVAIFRI